MRSPTGSHTKFLTHPGSEVRSNHNKATCALANKLARVCYATLRDHEPYGTTRLNKKLARTAVALPA